ncbi:MAG: DNA-3-methyladenine glycosylase 2 family protein [Alphaproteobacteria bacterium]|nr:DNA-3-methyladenine glycosylase 2 family protein [Alphaproteobacteria bacterium]
MLTLALKDFDIEQISESGQCFRMYRVADDTWEIFALDRFLKIRRREGVYVFYCDQNEFNDFWFDYFDLQTDYGEIKKRILAANDEYLIKAVSFGSGLRILRQDLWEVMVSFIISQQNNIPRIKNCLKKLCDMNGGKFPTPSDFLNFREEDLDSVKLGYRKNYLLKISESVSNSSFDLAKLRKMNYPEAMKYLKTLHGIGDKVANCVALFGMHRIEAFPIDVWIKRIIDTRYSGNFSLKSRKLRDIGGIVQQYMFFYERSSKV